MYQAVFQVSGDATELSHIRTLLLRLSVSMCSQVVILQSVVFRLASELELRLGRAARPDFRALRLAKEAP
jgi:hypothetical protein